jgi:TPR repeat protein
MAFLRRLIAGIALAAPFFAAFAGDVEDGDAAFHTKDYATAMKLLMPWAQKGDPVAELDVGMMYFGSAGVPQDRQEAAKWFKRAAEQGQRGAMVDLGITYATGDGNPRDLILAYMWFSLEADRYGGEHSTAYRDHVASELTPEELAAAKELAKKCLAASFKNCGH